jgi:cell division protein FtsN
MCTLVFILACGKKAPEEKALPQPEEQPAEPIPTPEVEEDSVKEMIMEPGKPMPERGAGLEVPRDRAYELQVVASRDYSKVFELKQKLEQLGYDVKITSTQKNGETFYRLRMEGTYTEDEAKKLGEQLKSHVPAVKDYWIAKVK